MGMCGVCGLRTSLNDIHTPVVATTGVEVHVSLAAKPQLGPGNRVQRWWLWRHDVCALHYGQVRRLLECAALGVVDAAFRSHTCYLMGYHQVPRHGGESHCRQFLWRHWDTVGSRWVP